jgi:hypothetical protein
MPRDLPPRPANGPIGVGRPVGLPMALPSLLMDRLGLIPGRAQRTIRRRRRVPLSCYLRYYYAMSHPYPLMPFFKPSPLASRSDVQLNASELKQSEIGVI